MNTNIIEKDFSINSPVKSMHDFGNIFIKSLPNHLDNLNISGRMIKNNLKMKIISTKIENVELIQKIIIEVLNDQVTKIAQIHAENTFNNFIQKKGQDLGILKFFNGWNETHKTTSLVSAKIIMRLSADAILIEENQKNGYLTAMLHLHQVAKDDFGLGHKGHDGMYHYLTAAFNASNWMDNQYNIKECNDFSNFLYKTGISNYNSALDSDLHNKSILNAMMVSIASELWNGCEYNYFSQFIENKLISYNPALVENINDYRNAKAYVLGHSGDIENKHGLHALAAASIFSNTRNIKFDPNKLKKVMLNYNYRVGLAFKALNEAIT